MNYILTIAIPTYNRSEILKKNLENIFGFIGFETEVFVSDNGSIDDTPQVCESFQRFSNFTYLRHQNNQGYDVNVMTCAENAKGEYIWFLSDDDSISLDLHRKVLSIIKTNKYAGMLINGKVIDRTSGKVLIESLAPLKLNTEVVANDFSMPINFKWSTLLSSQVIKRSAINYTVAQRFIGTIFIQLGIFWVSCRNERIYLLSDHYITKYDSITNNFGKSTAYIWLWNLLDAAKLLKECGYSYKAVRKSQSAIYKTGVLSHSGVVAHYVLSRIRYEGLGGLKNLKKIIKFVEVTIGELIALASLSILPDVIVKVITRYAKVLI
jgi:glycosyltransferase involved in cell wall biosynthesis